jgi:hypothetical protein
MIDYISNCHYNYHMIPVLEECYVQKTTVVTVPVDYLFTVYYRV